LNVERNAGARHTLKSCLVAAFRAAQRSRRQKLLDAKSEDAEERQRVRDRAGDDPPGKGAGRPKK
jgi:hypothetical protein